MAPRPARLLPGSDDGGLKYLAGEKIDVWQGWECSERGVSSM